MAITLIGGGARSGKSSFGLAYARRSGKALAFVATAQPFDEEMRQRIEKHKSDRGADFTIFEEPANIAMLIKEITPRFDAILVDCLTLWLTNLMLAGNPNLETEYKNLVEVSDSPQASIIFITNEVGCGIVPENALARRFRDEAGRLNQLVAAAAKDVFLMAFGIPMHIKCSQPQ